MIYLDEVSEVVYSHAFTSGNFNEYYISRVDSGRQSYLLALDFQDLVEKTLSFSQIVNLADSGTKFKNLYKDSIGLLYLSGVFNTQPIYLEFKNFTILHTSKELYVGYKNDYYLHLTIKEVDSVNELFVDNRMYDFKTLVGETSGISFPRKYKLTSEEDLVVPIIRDAIFIDRVDLYFNELKQQWKGQDDLRTYIKIKYKTMLRERILR